MSEHQRHKPAISDADTVNVASTVLAACRALSRARVRLSYEDKRECLHLAVICEGKLTMISGLPRYKVIFPDTETVCPWYC